ncbi:ecdysteroid-phosphate phosphatase-like [Topomyia yanbarensis]|uniref:ecdysteroid-phosphate phosphatase-like n=1 Tax=Topomyia yanbarensis TaxID=2498891 RepID=UPI00273B51BE|nr:ecdysteroid-phosphate phosphatase-like [Topomyia yanbarensis]
MEQQLEEMQRLPDGQKSDVDELQEFYDNAKKRISATVLASGTNRIEKQAPTGRRIYIARHAERIDFAFGDWIPYSFDETGNYIRKDLNMPKTLPKRSSSLWKSDTPLTVLGRYHARLTGEAMKEAGVQIDLVYSSPSFRCIQTAASILEGLGLQESHSIRVEPGLFEWTQWYQSGLPKWLTHRELVAAGYNVATDYEPFSTVEYLNQRMQETIPDYFQRNTELMKELIKTTYGNILVVGHAATLNTCTRHFVGTEMLPIVKFYQLLHKIPYCSMAVLESKNYGGRGDGWKLVEPPCYPLTNTKTERYDWKVLL